MARIQLKSASGETVTVDVRRGTGDQFVAEVGGERVEGVFQKLDAGRALFRLGDVITPCYFTAKDSRVEVWIEGETYVFDLVSTKRRSMDAASGPVAQEILAPMPGTVLRIEVKAGDAFAAHQPLIIMESMKMEMTLSAPHAGRIELIGCAVGELVPMGRVLAKLQPMESDAGVSEKS